MTPKTVRVGPSKRDLQLSYENGITLLIQSNFLRKNSPSAENKNNISRDSTGEFKDILINKVESVGNYALRIHFSDGHSTGIYSWEYLISLAEKLKNQ